MLSRLILAITLATIAGCSTKTPLSDAKPIAAERALAYQQDFKGSATIQVVRDTGFMGGGCYYALYVDNLLSARIDVGETVTFKVRPGERDLSVSRDSLGSIVCMGSDWMKTTKVILIPGEITLYRMGIDFLGYSRIWNY